MKTNPSAGKHFKKSILAAAMIIGASTMIFQGFTQTATASVYNKTKILPTTYANHGDVTSQTAGNSIPEGYVKADYTVGKINLPYYENKTPAEKDITKKAAAELAAQYLWQLYSADLNSQEIKMGYDEPTENLPRSFWTADIAIKGQDGHNDYTVDSYCVWIDSVTGELLNIGQDRTLKKNVPLGFDLALDQNPEKYGAEYIEAAKNLAKNYNVVHSAVKLVKYTGQGYSGNDPHISFEIYGENGEVALISISKYDKVLGGVVYHGEYKYDLIRIEKMEQEAKANAEVQEKAATTTSGNQTPSLR